MKINELREVVGRVTISFAVNPETKYLLQLGAKKAGVTFSEYCRQVIEGNIPEIKEEKEEKEETDQTTPKEKETSIIYATTKRGLERELRKLGYSKGVEYLVIEKGHPKKVYVGEKKATISRISYFEYMIEV